MKFKLEPVILIIFGILFIQTVIPLFGDGYHLNIDSPAHYMRVWCLEQQGVVPSNWCPYLNAGQPTSQYYYPIVDQLIVWLGMIIGLNFAYKIFVALALLVPALAVYYFLKSRGYKTAPLVAMGLVLFNRGSWHYGGFEESIMVGMWHYVLSVGLLIAALAAYAKYLEDPKVSRLALACVLTMLFTHPLSLVIGAVLYAAMTLAYIPDIRKQPTIILKFVAGALLLNAYYILPLATRLEYFFGNPTKGYSLESFMTYIGNYIPWYMVLLALAGFVTITKWKKSKPVMVFLIVVFGGMLINFTNLPLRNLFMSLRLGAFIAPAVFIAAGLGIETIIGIVPKPFGIWTGLLAGTIVVALTISTLWAANFTIMQSTDNYFQPQIQMYNQLKNKPPGRILVEETLYNMVTKDGMYPQSFTHSHNLLPVYTNREIVGFGTYFFPSEPVFMNTDKGNMFGKRVEEWSKEEILELFEKFNIRYVVSHGPAWTNYFATIATSVQQMPPFFIFELNVSGKYYDVGDAEVISSSYKPWGGKIKVYTPKPTKIIQKTNHYPTWGAKVDGKTVEVENCEKLTCAPIPAGEHTVEFYQRKHWADILGPILTILGILFFVYLKRKEG
ncbi:MAG: hypothetical protein ACE5FT_01215 [Candidatus Nanoarchaeia archaeon]